MFCSCFPHKSCLFCVFINVLWRSSHLWPVFFFSTINFRIHLFPSLSLFIFISQLIHSLSLSFSTNPHFFLLSFLPSFSHYLHLSLSSSFLPVPLAVSSPFPSLFFRVGNFSWHVISSGPTAIPFWQLPSYLTVLIHVSRCLP